MKREYVIKIMALLPLLGILVAFIICLKANRDYKACNRQEKQSAFASEAAAWNDGVMYGALATLEYADSTNVPADFDTLVTKAQEIKNRNRFIEQKRK